MNQVSEKSANLLQVEMNDMIPLIKEAVSSGGTMTIFPRGVSMLPMIRQGRDSVVLCRLPERLKKYDILLYQRANGSYVLHRVVKVKKDGYTCIGDNQVVCERSIKHESGIAVVSAFSRDGELHSVNGLSYKIYCRFWHITRPIRRVYRKLKRMFGIKKEMHK